MPNVKISITNVHTARSNVASSNADGQYVMPGLPIGKYDVKAEATRALRSNRPAAFS